MGLFSSANKDSRIGVDFLQQGVAVALLKARGRNAGKVLRAEFVEARGQEAQVEALRKWVQRNRLQKTPCYCLVAPDDRDIYQVEKPEVDDAEMIQALTWKIKDLLNFEVSNAVVESYSMPVSSKKNLQQIGVVAARETVIGSYVESIKSTALALNVLDVHELARSNLKVVRQSAGQSLVLLSFEAEVGLLSVYHDTDLYVSREFKIGIDQLELAGSDDESVFDALLLEIQRSLDYFESFYGTDNVADLRIFPRLAGTEKMAMYLRNLTSYDIDFITINTARDAPLDPHCFHAYCATLRGIDA